jgi:hypothetical protein
MIVSLFLHAGLPPEARPAFPFDPLRIPRIAGPQVIVHLASFYVGPGQPKTMKLMVPAFEREALLNGRKASAL